MSAFTLQIPDAAVRLDTEVLDHAEIEKRFGVDAAIARRLLAALDRTRSFAASGGTPGRWSWALVAVPASGQVDAVLTLDVFESAAGAEVYADAAERSIPEGVDVITRSIEKRDVAGSPAVVIHELLAPQPGEGTTDPASERASIAWFPPGAGLMLQLKVTTQDMLYFDDFAAWLVGIASTAELRDEART